MSESSKTSWSGWWYWLLAKRSVCSDLPDFLQRQKAGLDAIQFELPPHGISLEGIEKELIIKALQKFEWNQTQAAKYLDISRRTLIYRMEKYDLRENADESVSPP